MNRFKIGERVLIADSFTMKHRHHEGIIVDVHVSRYARPGVTSLDKYTILFEDGEQEDFYEMHLKSLAPIPEPCFTRAKLNRQYQDASEKYTHAIRELARSVPGNGFDAARSLAESARTKVAAARDALQAHRQEHNC